MLSAQEIAADQSEGTVIPKSRLGADDVRRAQDMTESFLAQHSELDANDIPSLIGHDEQCLEFARDPQIVDCVSRFISDDISMRDLDRSGKMTSAWRHDRNEKVS
jgi:hypothetical protein